VLSSGAIALMSRWIPIFSGSLACSGPLKQFGQRSINVSRILRIRSRLASLASNSRGAELGDAAGAETDFDDGAVTGAGFGAAADAGPSLSLRTGLSFSGILVVDLFIVVP
jgi:hypothetical protein